MRGGGCGVPHEQGCRGLCGCRACRVRAGADLLALAESGVAGALVATAVHDGVISGEEW